MFFKRFFFVYFRFVYFRTFLSVLFYFQHYFRFRTFICVSNEKRRTKTKKNEINRKKTRPIFYRLQTSADVKRHQKASADENLTN